MVSNGQPADNANKNRWQAAGPAITRFIVMSQNPYQPPAEIQDSTDVTFTNAIREFDAVGNIHFSGRPDWHDLNQFLSRHESLDAATITLIWLLSGVSIFVMFIAALYNILLITIGIACLAILATIVSTHFYRRLVFTSANPGWNQYCSGEIRNNGVYILRNECGLFVSWECVIEVVVQEDIFVILIPSSIGQSLIITAEMVSRDDDVSRLRFWLTQVRERLETTGTLEERLRTVKDLQREPTRERTISIPPDAIPFSGPIDRGDISRISRFVARKSRRLRAIAVRLVITLSVLMIVFGFLGSIGVPNPWVFVVVGAMAFVVWKRQTRRSNAGSQMGIYQFIHAFADDQGITSDLAATVTSLPWNQIEILIEDEDLIALGHNQSPRVSVARQDMFAADNWGAFREMVHSQTKS